MTAMVGAWVKVNVTGSAVPSYAAEASTIGFDGRCTECPDCNALASGFRPTKKDGELVGWSTLCGECRSTLVVYND